MAVKISRKHLRLRVSDLRPGEHGVLHQFTIKVKEDRTVYINGSDTLHGVWGKHYRAPSHHEGSCIVRREEDKSFTLVIPKNFLTQVSDYVSGSDLIEIGALVEMADDDVPCATCRGKGYYTPAPSK